MDGNTLQKTVWTEKHRPASLDQVVGQNHIVPILKKFVKKKDIPHMSYVGRPSIGKTTCAIALARDLYGEQWKNNFLELNASDERGIDVVRSKIKNYAKIAPPSLGFRIIFLDEADNLTSDSQQALRRVIEKYSRICRFILSCNNPEGIIDPIKDRCAEFRFRLLSKQDVHQLIKRVAKEEDVNISIDAIVALSGYADGSARKALNTLQTLTLYSDGQGIDTDMVRSMIPHVDEKEVDKLYKICKKGGLKEAQKKLLELLHQQQLFPSEILNSLTDIIFEDSKLPYKAKLYLLTRISEVDKGTRTSPRVYLHMCSFIAQIITVWNKIKKKRKKKKVE